MPSFSQLDIRKALLALAGVLTLSVAYYFSVAVPASEKARLDFEKQKYEEQEQKRASNQISLDLCLQGAETARLDYLKLNGEVTGDTVKAPDHVFQRADAEKKMATDECFRKFGGR